VRLRAAQKFKLRRQCQVSVRNHPATADVGKSEALTAARTWG
jgi:hypothetical protein